MAILLTREERLERAEKHGEFAAVLRRREELGKIQSSFFNRDEETGMLRHPLQRAMWQEIQDAWRARFPKRKSVVATETGKAWAAVRRAAAAGKLPELEAIEAGYQALAKELVEKVGAERDQCELELCRLAEGLEVPRGSFWTPIGSVSETTYSSQGYGAGHYARGAAEETADKARAAGLEVRILKVEQFRYTERHWRTGADMGTKVVYRYDVEALTTPIGAEILRYKPGPSLRERVRRCWARGINPRVTLWWLPAGYEEKEGLDFFGGEVARESA